MDQVVLAALDVKPEEARDLILFVTAEGLGAWSEAADMEKSWFNEKERSYTVPAEKSKSRKPITRYLGDYGLKILTRRAKNSASGYLFANPRTGKPFTRFSGALKEMGNRPR